MIWRFQSNIAWLLFSGHAQLYQDRRRNRGEREKLFIDFKCVVKGPTYMKVGHCHNFFWHASQKINFFVQTTCLYVHIIFYLHVYWLFALLFIYLFYYICWIVEGAQVIRFSFPFLHCSFVHMTIKPLHLNE